MEERTRRFIVVELKPDALESEARVARSAIDGLSMYRTLNKHRNVIVVAEVHKRAERGISFYDLLAHEFQAELPPGTADAVWKALESASIKGLTAWEGEQGRLYPAAEVQQLAAAILAKQETKIYGIGPKRALVLHNCASNLLAAEIE